MLESSFNFQKWNQAKMLILDADPIWEEIEGKNYNMFEKPISKLKEEKKPALRYCLLMVNTRKYET